MKAPRLNTFTHTTLALLLSTGVLAGDMTSEKDQTSQLEEEFSVLDSNADGRIVPKEAAQLDTLAKAFTEADKDKSGSIDIAEYVIHQTKATAAGRREKEKDM